VTSSRPFTAALLLVLALGVSCSSWRELRSDEPPADVTHAYGRLRVELIGGTKVVLRHAQFSADTVWGEPEWLTKSLRRKLTKEGAAILPDKSVGVPVALIRRLDKRGFTAVGTTATVVLLAGIGALVAIGIALSQWEGGTI